jgi:hypothetical protein
MELVLCHVVCGLQKIGALPGVFQNGVDLDDVGCGDAGGVAECVEDFRWQGGQREARPGRTSSQ